MSYQAESRSSASPAAPRDSNHPCVGSTSVPDRPPQQAIMMKSAAPAPGVPRRGRQGRSRSVDGRPAMSRGRSLKRSPSPPPPGLHPEHVLAAVAKRRPVERLGPPVTRLARGGDSAGGIVYTAMMGLIWVRVRGASGGGPPWLRSKVARAAHPRSDQGCSFTAAITAVRSLPCPGVEALRDLEAGRVIPNSVPRRHSGEQRAAPRRGLRLVLSRAGQLEGRTLCGSAA